MATSRRFTLVIAEKPSSCQKIATALADGKVERKGKAGAYYFELEHAGKPMVAVPAVGHLYGLREREKTHGYPVFDVEWAPSFEASKTAGFTKAYLNNIIALAKSASEFYSACDYDIEGEVIGANIVEFACKAKDARRMKFSTLTKEELLDAFDNALPHLDAGLVAAGRTRHKLDFFWGISLSRALMSAMKSAGRFQIMSVGRVQGPALAVICRREKEITVFVPVPYWQVFALVKDVAFEHEHGKFDAEAEAKAAVAAAGKNGSVTQVKKSRYNQLPPFPFDLTTLQTEAYRAFGLTPTQTLATAQKLYEGALISYPRTASQKLSEKLGLPAILRKMSAIPPFEKLAARLLEQGRTKPHEGPNSDPAHPAIYPTGVKPNALQGAEAKVYDLVAKRFLACFAKPAVRERMSVQVKLGTQLFNASGSRTLEQNWFEYYAPYVKLEEMLMPPFTEGEAVTAQKVWSEHKQTQPPKRFTQASLVRKLEEENLGTKATRAGIIQTLLDRGYVRGKSLEATPLGMSVFEALEKNADEILRPELTRHFEEEIQAISEGGKKPEDVEGEARTELTRLLDDFRKKEASVGRELLKSFNDTARESRVLGACKACGKGSLVMRSSRFGVFVGCSAYPACRQTYPLPRECAPAPTGKECEKCGTPIVTIRRKGKRPFSMCLAPACETKKDWAKPNASA